MQYYFAHPLTFKASGAPLLVETGVALLQMLACSDADKLQFKTLAEQS